ncbi:hypothetical protein RALTA_A0938 [Cupriavidus taiwanensis LMG 19424]|uniref:Uncharacterized protein n=1 Tax=Cupriavidus taiwanensis (strain DSM 17343 / BCRC 17206 / CCUG 44338 / CIP 107171 / LMG 19424 / R1) TaxID=977880 RepID=B3R3M3_CUPTR|nr:hypothetical protein RALTA_A0938 [Cupriavidus taiwanensis LMG 19424]
MTDERDPEAHSSILGRKTWPKATRQTRGRGAWLGTTSAAVDPDIDARHVPAQPDPRGSGAVVGDCVAAAHRVAQFAACFLVYDGMMNRTVPGGARREGVL